MSGHGHGAVEGSNKSIALLISVLALFLAFSETLGKSAQTDAISQNVEASNLWAFFQAKTVRMTVLRTAGEGAELQRAALPEGVETLSRLNDRDVIAMRPDGPGRILIALDVDAVAELQGLPYGPLPVDHPLVGRVMTLAANAAPSLAVAQPTEAIIAPRPMPADGYPSVGSVPGIPGYFEAITHSGVTLAPLIGRALAAEILGQPPYPLLAPYRPDRFAV